jgi:hypothetical protein
MKLSYVFHIKSPGVIPEQLVQVPDQPRGPNDHFQYAGMAKPFPDAAQKCMPTAWTLTLLFSHF